MAPTGTNVAGAEAGGEAELQTRREACVQLESCPWRRWEPTASVRFGVRLQANFVDRPQGVVVEAQPLGPIEQILVLVEAVLEEPLAGAPSLTSRFAPWTRNGSRTPCLAWIHGKVLPGPSFSVVTSFLPGMEVREQQKR